MEVEATIIGSLIGRKAREAGEALVAGSNTTRRADWLTESLSPTRASETCASGVTAVGCAGNVGGVGGVGCV